METKIILGYEFTKNQLKQLDITSSKDLNGWYNYDTHEVVINVISDDFSRRKTFNTIKKYFSQIVTHETIHHIIWEITKNKMANNTEEKFIELMTGERNW